MESLPQEINRYVFSFVPEEWLRLCTKDHFQRFMSSHPVYEQLVQWMYYKKLEDKNRRKLNLTRLELLSLQDIRPVFRNFRDVDQHFLRKCELEGEREHFGKWVQLYHKKSQSTANRLKRYYNLSRLEMLYERYK